MGHLLGQTKAPDADAGRMGASEEALPSFVEMRSWSHGTALEHAVQKWKPPVTYFYTDGHTVTSASQPKGVLNHWLPRWLPTSARPAERPLRDRRPEPGTARTHFAAS